MYLPSYGAQFLPREHSSDFVLRASVSGLKKDSETPRNYPRARFIPVEFRFSRTRPRKETILPWTGVDEWLFICH